MHNHIKPNPKLDSPFPDQFRDLEYKNVFTFLFACFILHEAKIVPSKGIHETS